MTHLPYIAACYGLAIGIPAVLAVAAAHRLAEVRRRLAVLDPRA